MICFIWDIFIAYCLLYTLEAKQLKTFSIFMVSSFFAFTVALCSVPEFTFLGILGVIICSIGAALPKSENEVNKILGYLKPVVTMWQRPLAFITAVKSAVLSKNAVRAATVQDLLRNFLVITVLLLGATKMDV